MERNLAVVMDVDGVIFDYVGQLGDVVSTILDRPRNEFPPADTWDFMTQQWGMEFDEYLELVEQGVRDHKFFGKGIPLPGSSVGWKMLADSGARIHIASHCGITSLASQEQQNRLEWLDEWGFIYDDITFTPDKASVAKMYLDQGWEVASLDDHVDNYWALHEVGSVSYLAHQRSNSHVPTTRRVANVEEFAKKINSTRIGMAPLEGTTSRA
jgi:hypothetical protein